MMRFIFNILFLKRICDHYKHTLGVFLSVFRLTSTGLSYLTRDAFGGIILMYKVLIPTRLFWCNPSLVASMTTDNCACRIKQEAAKRKTEWKKKIFRVELYFEFLNTKLFYTHFLIHFLSKRTIS